MGPGTSPQIEVTSFRPGESAAIWTASGLHAILGSATLVHLASAAFPGTFVVFQLILLGPSLCIRKILHRVRTAPVPYYRVGSK